MRILMIGGTRFVGRHIVAAALAAGHEVTIFHRGHTGAELFPEVEHRIGDRNDDLSALADGSWDATVDTCAYFPRQVRHLAEALGARAGRYALISSVSVYGPPLGPNYSEGSPLQETDDPLSEVITNENYGALKALCEREALTSYGESTLVVRPTYVVGPDDFSWRFPYWVDRIARGGEVLAPGPATDHAQVIDVRDMASWIVSMLEGRRGGVFHAVGPSSTFTWGEELQAIVEAVAPSGTTLTWIDEAFLHEQKIDGETLPLWTGGEDDRLMMAADPSAAFDAGLRPRPLADTIADTREWITSQSTRPEPALSAARETELLSLWHDNR